VNFKPVPSGIAVAAPLLILMFQSGMIMHGD
jgi:hypothetical protein